MKKINCIKDNERLLKEWNWERNKKYHPGQITHGSTKQIWWKCSKGHEWQTSPNSRIKKNYISGCPYCANTKLLKGFNDLKSQNPKLAKEWNKAKNKIKASDVLYGSDTKYWWICSKGHEWQTSIIERKANRNCPYCSNTRFKTGYNDLATLNPNLAKEWNYEKNKLKPSEVKYGGSTKYWWKCLKGHEWQSSIAKRKSGGKCIYCINHTFKSGYNDLATLNPNLAKEWNYEKNKIKASDVLYGSDTKYWWICPKGHEWQTSINVRKAGNNCPYCSKSNPAVTKEESFGALFPALLKEWDYTKNAKLDPFKLRIKTSQKAWWICPKGHQYYTYIYFKTTKGSGCPICFRENQTSFPEQAIFYYLNKLFPDAKSRYKIDMVEVDIFIPCLKLGIEYDGMYYHKGKKSIDKEQKKHIFLKEKDIDLIRIKETKNTNKSLKNIIYYQYTTHYKNLDNAIKRLIKLINNKYFLNKKIEINLEKDRINIFELYLLNEKENSIATKHPELLKEWNYERNKTLKPEFFRALSSKKVWWKCLKGHEWQTTPNARVQGSNCPYCSKRKVLKGFNDLGSLYPVVAKDWHPEKNGKLTPFDVMPNSNKKVWWICSNGHEWQTTIQSKTSSNNGCPYCSNKKVLSGFNDLKSLCPEIALEWDYARNKNLFPDQIIKGSDKKVWWKCTNGHNWKESIKIRTKTNKKCPYCVGARIIVGETDLATTHPKLLKYWNFEKNHHIKPTEVKHGSDKKVWWICSKGHEYSMRIYHKTIGYNCPYCSNKKVLSGFNDLATTHPQILKEWDYTKNKNISPNQITSGSSKKVWWKCIKNKHNYKMLVVSKAKGYNCPYCSNKRVLPGFNDLATTHPQILKEWDYTKNKDISPTRITSGSSKKVWWNCKKHNISWKTTANNRIKGTNCPICAEEKRLKTLKQNKALKNGFLKKLYPDLLKEWNYEKNISIGPDIVSATTTQKVWWKCLKCKYEWQTKIVNRTKYNTGCPKCSNEKKKETYYKSLLKRKKPLSITHSELLKEWNYKKNKNINPEKITYGSGIKAWWICSKGHEWQSPIYKKAKSQNCPFCKNNI